MQHDEPLHDRGDVCRARVGVRQSRGARQPVLPATPLHEKVGPQAVRAVELELREARGKYVAQSTLASYMKVTTNGLPNIKNLENALDHYTELKNVFIAT